MPSIKLRLLDNPYYIRIGDEKTGIIVCKVSDLSMELNILPLNPSQFDEDYDETKDSSTQNANPIYAEQGILFDPSGQNYPNENLQFILKRRGEVIYIADYLDNVMNVNSGDGLFNVSNLRDAWEFMIGEVFSIVRTSSVASKNTLKTVATSTSNQEELKKSEEEIVVVEPIVVTEAKPTEKQAEPIKVVETFKTTVQPVAQSTPVSTVKL